MLFDSPLLSIFYFLGLGRSLPPSCLPTLLRTTIPFQTYATKPCEDFCFVMPCGTKFWTSSADPLPPLTSTTTAAAGFVSSPGHKAYTKFPAAIISIIALFGFDKIVSATTVLVAGSISTKLLMAPSVTNTVLVLEE